MQPPIFLKNLRHSGLLSDAQYAEVDERSAGMPLHELTTDLVGQGWLTPYQVKRLFAGQARGLILGQYRILDELGRGGFGCVYKAMHGIMNRVVAIKVIAPELVEESQARSWFRREVLATTQLYHPNIVMAYDANEVDEALFLVMEFVDGPNLDQQVRRQGPLPIGLACTMLHQVARALQYAHEKGMVHRDIKPANLLLPGGTTEPVDPGGAAPLVKVVDFGLARLHGKGSTNTLQLQNDKGFVGTPAYISPEQARSVHEVDIRSDLYSLGCTFYFAIGGRAPFRGQNPLETVLQHVEKEAEPLGSVRPETPPAVASIIRRLMAKNPEHRFQTPADLIAELAFLCAPGAAHAVGPAPVPHRLDVPVSDAKRNSQTFQLPPGPAVPTEHAAVAADLPEMTRVLPVEPRALERDAASGAVVPQPAPVADSPDAEEHAKTAVLTPVEKEEPKALDQSAELPAPVDDALRQAWGQWSLLIATAAQGGRPAISASAYRALHLGLVAALRMRAASEVKGGAWQRLESLVAPWLTLDTLQATDRPTMADLHRSCQALSRPLGLLPASWKTATVTALAATFLVAACVAGFVLFSAGPPAALSIPSVPALWRIAEKSPYALILLPLALGSFFVLPRLLRR